MHGKTSNEPVADVRSRDRIAQLDYIRSMIRELRAMAAAERFEMLTLLLEMAYLEANDKLRELHLDQTSKAGKHKAGRSDNNG